jgi:hypothetical protein
VTKFKGLLEGARIHRPNTEEEGFLKWMPPRRGRPPGKRSHPDFEQITAYIRKDTHHAVKIVLLQNGRKEFSELVEELLGRWLKSST